MAKRVQEQKEERIAAKSRPTALNLFSTVLASSSSAKDPIASKSLGNSQLQGNLKAGEKKFKTRRSVEFSSEAERCIHCGVDGESGQGKVSQQMKINLNLEAIMKMK